MAAVTHAHYIRTIHTSFTASASASSQYLNQVHYQHSPTTNISTNIPTNTPTNTSRHPPYAQSINTHNTHMYTHHLRDLAPHRHNHPSKQDSFSLAAQQQQQQQQQQQGQQQGHEPPRTRRRSLSIRMPPTASPYPSAYTHKFDPFADEPITPVLALPSSSPPPPLSQAQAQAQAQGMRRVHEAPYTIQIPAAQQADIQLYTSSSSPQSQSQAQAQYQAPQISIPIPRTPRLAAASLPPPAPATKQSRPLSPRAPTFTPRSSSVSPPPSLPSPSSPSNSNSLNANTATPTNQTQNHPPTQKHTNPNPNLSKVVASILLNRVTAGARHRGGPTGLMRRRALVGGLREGRGQGGEAYVKSCLSSVVFVEA